MAKIVRVIINGVRVVILVIGVIVTAFVSLTYAVLVYVIDGEVMTQVKQPYRLDSQALSKSVPAKTIA